MGRKRNLPLTPPHPILRPLSPPLTHPNHHRYVRTIMGRKRDLPDAKGKGPAAGHALVSQ